MVEAPAKASPLEERELRDELLRVGNAAIPALRNAIESHDSPKCSRAAEILVAIDPQAAFPALIAALKSTNLTLRQKAIELLGDIGNQDAVPVLLEHMSHERAILQVWVVQSLGKLKDDRAVDTLLALLKADTPSSLRYMAVEALGVIGNRKALPMIKALRDDPDHHVRSRVETALKLFGESS
jgi:HEAT repeat protein